ncbi:MAG TPA: protein kinase [Gemmatimonadales bacterium]|nr:protein kinase [Gemmatimonadales bacterium]
MEIADPLQRALGTAYRLERELGQGGMSTVFLAEDRKHQRKVAVKVLRQELAAALGPDRFNREIRIAARLQHPHILPLLDSGESDGFLWYVMPYVDGPSLRDRLSRQGELPVHEAVRLLVEIADALAFAHAQGVVHRDIKPDNVLLSGRHALVMDFGVAKAVSDAGAARGDGRDASAESLTTAGLAIGTPAYMAPEQATADPNLDHRVDIYALGVVAYELLTGRTPFHGLTPQQMLAAHVTEQPVPIARHRPALPAALQTIVMRCLAKHPADRWQTAHELLGQLEPLMTPSGGVTPTQTMPVQAAARPPASWRTGFGLAATAVVALAIAGAIGWSVAHRRPDAIAFGRRTQVTLDPGLELDPALSPDGKLVAYAGGPSGEEKIYVRQLDGGSTLAVTAGVPGELRRPQWSPDGARIAFQSPRGIELVAALGGTPRLLVPSPAPDTAADLAWSPDGKRFVYRQADSLLVRGIEGGAPRRLVTGPELYAPSWSPDGKWIAYVSGNRLYIYGARSQLGNLAPSRIMVVPAEGGTPVQVAAENALNLSPVWLPTGRQLLFVSSRQGGRDVYRVALTGTGTAAGAPERVTTGLNAATISLTPDGTRLAYSSFGQTSNVWALPVPRGAPVAASRATPVTSGNQIVESFDISRDGRWIAFDTDRNGPTDIYRRLLAGGEDERLTSDPADDFQPQYSPDGREIGFHAFRGGSRDLFVMPAEGGEARPVIATGAEERDVAWSPDGRRMAFASDATGHFEIYSTERRASGWSAPTQLTRTGGIFPFWSPDGRTLVFSWNDGAKLVPSTGGDPRPLPMTGPIARRQSDAFAYTWAPDSRHVFTVVSNDTVPFQTMWSVPIDGGAPRPLIHFDDPHVTFGRGTFVVREETIYFALLRSDSDIWIAEVESGKRGR